MEVVSGYVVPTNNYSAQLSQALVVPGNLLVYGYEFYSSNASAQWVLVFDASALPADTSVPIFAHDAPSKVLRGNSWSPNGRAFNSGIVLCTSSTDTTLTLGSADTFFDVQFVNLDTRHYGEG